MVNKIIFAIVFITTSLDLIQTQPQRVKFKKVLRENEKYALEDAAESLGDLRILIAIIIKNHQHSLPTFLATLETLECPNKIKKCDLW